MSISKDNPWITDLKGGEANKIPHEYFRIFMIKCQRSGGKYKQEV